MGTYWVFGADHTSTLRASFGRATSDKKHNAIDNSTLSYNKERNQLTTWSLGFEQGLSARTAVWLEYENSNVKQKFTTKKNNLLAANLTSRKYKNDKFSIGVRHDF